MRQRLAVSAIVLPISVLCVGCPQKSKPRTDREPPQQRVAVAPEKHVAPDGTFFLTERLSITTNSGVTGLARGSKVTFIAAIGDKLRVTDGVTELVVHPSQLTNDLDLARSLAAADSREQRQVASAIAQRQTEYEQNRAAQQAALAREQQSHTPRPRPSRWNNPLDRPVYDRTQDKKYQDANGKTYWIDVQGRRHYDN